MRRVILAAMLTALMPAFAYAQYSDGAAKGPATVRTEKEMKNDAEIDKAYQQTLKRLKSEAPAAAAKTDPWQSVRPINSGDKAKQ